MNQEHEEILKKAYLACGAIQIFQIMQKEIFEGIDWVNPPSMFLVGALNDGLIKIRNDILQLKKMVISRRFKVVMLQSSIVSLNTIIRCLSGEDDKGEAVENMNFRDWERLQIKMSIILKQTYQTIESLCRLIKTETT